jgi:small conductance mechanosensitive channel
MGSMAERWRGSIRRWAGALALSAGLTLWASAACAQSFPGLTLATPGPSGSSALDALYNSAPIVLDGVPLFRIVVPAEASDQQSIAARANAVSVALDQLLATTDRDGVERTLFDPATLHVEIVREGDQLVLEAVDANHHDGTPIVTVTSADAEYRQTNPDALAAVWQGILQNALVRSLDIRKPEIQRRNVNSVLTVAGILAAFTLIMAIVGAWFGRRIAALATAIAERDAAVEAERTSDASPDDAEANAARHRRLIGLLIIGLDPHKKLTLYRALRLIGIALVVLAWFSAVTWAALQFPQTATLGHTIFHNGLAIAVIWIGALLIDRLLTIVVDRLPALWELRSFSTPEDQQRRLLRAPTIARALAGLKTSVLIFLAALATMAQVGIPVGSVVTIGGLAAIAVSLAAQNLIRDVVSGFLVLIEDQYVVGDSVTINGNRGSVERLTLRMVQIRDATGSLVTISHSSATQVINHSRNWSRVDYEISVDPASNIAFAMSLVRQQIADLETDPEWKDAIVEPAEWIGIDAMSRDGAIIRARIKTAPLRQFALRREINGRVAKAFAAAKIAYGAPAPPSI